MTESTPEEEFLVRQFKQPSFLASTEEALRSAPKTQGLYGWYFKSVPPSVSTEGCVHCDGKTLLYVGISPARDGSRNFLRRRLESHIRGNASKSTLRLSLGLLLQEALGLKYGRYRDGSDRLTFGDGERKLSEWMTANAYVYWIERDRPKDVEGAVIRALSLPLNIDGNKNHPNYASMKRIRKAGADNAERYQQKTS